MKYLSLIILTVTLSLHAQVIDVHLHSYTSNDYWGGRDHPLGIGSPPTAEQHLKATIAEMDRQKIRYAVVSGTPESVAQYCQADPRFIPGYMDEEELISLADFEQLIIAGKMKVFGEVAGVYHGRTLNDSLYHPYLALCEKYGIPVAYHTGGGPPSTPYRCCPNFRIGLGDPLLIEDVLVRYPKLKVYLMHAGEVFHQHALRMLKMYPQLHVDLGVLLWIDPLLKEYVTDFLQGAQKSGVLDRVMFGSDQMVWPGAIGESIRFLEGLAFLSEEEKRMILHDNALRFLELDE